LFSYLLPPSCLKVCFEEVIERPHMILFGKQKMIGYILHYLTHQRQSTFYFGWRLLIYYTRLVWGN